VACFCCQSGFTWYRIMTEKLYVNILNYHNISLVWKFSVFATIAKSLYSYIIIIRVIVYHICYSFFWSQNKLKIPIYRGINYLRFLMYFWFFDFNLFIYIFLRSCNTFYPDYIGKINLLFSINALSIFSLVLFSFARFIIFKQTNVFLNSFNTIFILWTKSFLFISHPFVNQKSLILVLKSFLSCT